MLRDDLKAVAPRRLNAADADFARLFAGLVEESRDTASEVDQVVTEILATVRDRKSTRLNSSHYSRSRMPSSA